MTRILSLAIALSLALGSATDDLTAADANTAAGAGNVVKKTDDVKNWRLEQHEEGKGTIAAADGAIVFNVTNEDGTEWHVQAFQTPVDLKDGQEYVVTFKA